MVSVSVLALKKTVCGLRFGRKILNADGFIFWSLLPFFPPREIWSTQNARHAAARSKLILGEYELAIIKVSFTFCDSGDMAFHYLLR